MLIIKVLLYIAGIILVSFLAGRVIGMFSPSDEEPRK